MLKGIDVSHHQTNLDNYIKGIDFIIIKASEGRSMKDNKRLDHLKMAKDNKLLYGFYHYAHPELNTVASEVNNFLSCVPSECIGDCLLVLDWEGKALKENINWAYDFLNLVYKKTGVRPLIYCQASYTSKLSKIVKGNFGLWVAQYKNNTNKLPLGEYPSKDNKPTIGAYPFWAMWQFSSTPIDRDIFNGTKSQFKAYCKR